MKKFMLFIVSFLIIIIGNQAQTVIDYDGNTYDTIAIGTQVWLKQNLRVTHFNDGTPIPNVTDSAEWANLITPARCYYENDSAEFDSVYGTLYNWYAANNPNICPSGWHVSTNPEWLAVETYLGGESIAGGKMKETDTIHWASPNVGATNSSGFTGLPAGMREFNSNFKYIRENGLWWTTTTYNTYAWSTYLWYLFSGVDHNPTPKFYGLNIRCIKNSNSNVEEMNSKKQFKIYPNPAYNSITIDFTGIRKSVLTIYNIIGEVVLQCDLNYETNRINVQTLPSGIYILKVSDPERAFQQKLVIE